MIMRIWHGMTRAEDAGAYRDFLQDRAIPDYRGVAGNRAVWVLRRLDGARAHFLTVTLWESEEAIRAFAGEEMEKAKYYPEDQAFLLEFEPTVTHYEVCGTDA